MLKKMQGRFKESSRGLGLALLKIFSGFIIGLTFALIFKQLLDVGNFVFTFIIVLFIGVFFKLSGKWQYTGVLLFNLFCVMTAMLLRMYIVVAPGQ
ncbi:MAG: hypothetical protein SGI74_07570 [Oligoflexia bacterium]|nr:hypothetical protein [Oligoflexia bacterium]